MARLVGKNGLQVKRIWILARAITVLKTPIKDGIVCRSALMNSYSHLRNYADRVKRRGSASRYRAPRIWYCRHVAVCIHEIVIRHPHKKRSLVTRIPELKWVFKQW